MEDEILQVRSDTLFHDLFNENEIETLEWIVMQILGCNHEDIKGKVKVKNIRVPRTNKKERNNYLDLIVEYKNEKIILELNNNFKRNYTRNLMYAFNTILNNYNLNEGDYYKEITKVVLVNLNWFSREDLSIKPKDVNELSYPDYDVDSYILKIININLDYFSKLCYDEIDISDKLYKLLTIKSKEELAILIKNEKLLKGYSKKILNLSSNEEYRREIMDEIIERNAIGQQRYFEGKKDGFDEGLEQGILEKEREVVLNMYKENLDLEIISKCTNLTIEEIQEIINK